LLGELAERIRAEASLRAMAAGFQRLMDSNVLRIMQAPTDGTLTDANETFLSMFGYSRGELDACELCWQHICNSEKAFGKSREVGTFATAELQFVRKSGEKMKLLFIGKWEVDRQQVVGFTFTLP
jgi:PAS domain-containing protein